MKTTCDECGQEYQIGQWYRCPHGWPLVAGGPSVVDDSIPGGMVIENMGPEPRTFYSRSEHKRAMKELGLTPKVRHVGVAGSDKSPHTQRWI